MQQESIFSSFASPSTQAAAQAQDHIGWSNLLLGQLAVAWSDLQHSHLTSIASHWTSTSWAVGVVTHLLAVSHSVWVYCNQVVHDWTLDGLAHATELQVSEELHAQYVLSLQGLPFSKQHYIKGHSVDSFCMHLSQIANVGCLSPSSWLPVAVSRYPRFASWITYLPSPPTAPLES